MTSMRSSTRLRWSRPSIWTDAPNVRKSILNFGLPDIAIRTIDETAVGEIPEEIQDRDHQFRTATRGRTRLRIERDKTVDPVELKMRFIVRADLTCDPVHVPVEFVADIIDTGKIVVNRL